MLGLRTAFTLIELLIVVAIIAILAAIAVPNFLEAQTRAKVSRARADLRTLSTGLETYHLDNNTYPRQNTQGTVFQVGTVAANITLERLTTPISYLSGESVFYDPFKPKLSMQGADLNTPQQKSDLPENEQKAFEFYHYSARQPNGGSSWRLTEVPNPSWYILAAAGPAAVHYNLTAYINAMKQDNNANRIKSNSIIYNATNGTVSRGSVWRVGGAPVGRAVSFYHAVTGAQ